VLVGAGFSRNARLAAANSALPPLWPDFTQVMSRRLYGDDTSATANALRLAEEYAAVHGRAALDDLIRELVPDESWLPGEAHDRLLALPWTDVLTTNWDTLLERAAQTSLHTRYGVVRTVGDMATTRAPRIVKLHGSMPSHTPFTFTEEDYRRYPSTHAPFVNLARQVFIENELVLLGFGGEDPNFLQWAGWVRDELRDRSRRLYLVGVLHLPTSRRRLLESLNIAVVDLYPAVASLALDARHASGTQLLLSFLEAGKPRSPRKWPFVEEPNEPPSPSLDHYNDVIRTWRANRLEYPGWLLCPPGIRERVRAATELTIARCKPIYKDKPAELLLELARESAWRCLTAGVAPAPWLANAMEAILADAELLARLDSPGKLDIALAISDAARVEGNDVLLERRLGLLQTLRPEASNWVAFFRGLRLRDTLQVSALENLLDDIQGDDPVWLLRRAGLNASVGRLTEARELYRRALVDLRKRLIREPDSIWIRSRLAWAELFARVSQGFFDEKLEADPLARISRDEPALYEHDLDPWREIEHLRFDLHEAERSGFEDRARSDPHFDSGVYGREPVGPRDSFGAESLVAASIQFVLDTFASTGQVGHVSFLAAENRRASAMTDLSVVGAHDRATSLCTVSKRSRLLPQIYRRAVVATMPRDRVTVLVRRMLDFAVACLERCDAATGAGADAFDAHSHWVAELNMAMESLSRLSMREVIDAASLHRTVLSWARRPSLTHWWTHECYARLVSRTWEAVPAAVRPSFTLEHLAFPLVTELAVVDDMDYWPDPLDPAIRYSRPSETGAWDQRLGQLVRLAGPSEKSRKHALRRLVHLLLSGVTTAQESNEIGRALWSSVRGDGLPADTGLHDFVVFEVPAPPGKDCGALFWSAYFAERESVRVDERWLLEVGAGCDQAARRGLPGPSAATARRWAESLMQWRPNASTDPFGWHSVEATSRRTPAFLQHAVFARLENAQFDDVLWNTYMEFAQAVPRALGACAYFCARNVDFTARALEAVRRNLWHGDRPRSLAAAHAVVRWLEDVPHLAWQPLIEDVIALCAVPRHPAASVLWQALAQAVHRDFVPALSLERVLQALEALDRQTDYSTWDALDVHWEEEAPLVIVEAIQTASELINRGHFDPLLTRWSDRPLGDPLPEVRAARPDT
jgi:hypothetical protein